MGIKIEGICENKPVKEYIIIKKDRALEEALVNIINELSYDDFIEFNTTKHMYDIDYELALMIDDLIAHIPISDMYIISMM